MRKRKPNSYLHLRHECKVLFIIRYFKFDWVIFHFDRIGCVLVKFYQMRTLCDTYHKEHASRWWSILDICEQLVCSTLESEPSTPVSCSGYVSLTTPPSTKKRTFPCSTRLVSITILRQFSCQIIRQKSLIVVEVGP